MITLGALAVLIVVIVMLRFALDGQVERIREFRAEEAAFLQAGEVAGGIIQQLGRRDDVVEQLDALLPQLTDVANIEDDIANVVNRFFVRKPDVKTGGVSPHPENSTVQVILLTIEGRLRIENFDLVIEELRRLPVLLEVQSASLDIRVVASPQEGRATYRVVVFSRFVSS